MTTAQILINDAADKAGVKGQGQDLSGDRNATYVRALNRMLASWRNEGIDLGLGALSAGDTVYVDSADEEAIVYHLTTRIYEVESRPINQAVYLRAQELKESLEAKYLNINEMELPESLKSNLSYSINNG